jgi:hypothetical protein
MSPEIIRATGKVASDTVVALQNQPLMLALIVLQILVLGVVLYTSVSRQKATTEQFKNVYALLEKCIERSK